MSNYQSSDQQDYIKQLTGEYGISYIKCATYIHNLNYGIMHEKNCLLQILDDFMTAQKEGRSIEKITGKSLIGYCDNIVKAELERMSNKTLYRVQFIIGLIFSVLILIFFNNTVFMQETYSIREITSLRLNGLELIFLISILVIYFGRKLFTKLLFHHVKISRITGAMICFLVYAVFSFTLNNNNINNSKLLLTFEIPIIVYIILVVITAISLVTSLKIQKKYPAFQTVTLEEPLEEPDPVKCPVCGKEHDFDYPKCPHCGHEYMF